MQAALEQALKELEERQKDLEMASGRVVDMYLFSHAMQTLG